MTAYAYGVDTAPPVDGRQPRERAVYCVWHRRWTWRIDARCALCPAVTP